MNVNLKSIFTSANKIHCFNYKKIKTIMLAKFKYYFKEKMSFITSENYKIFISSNLNEPDLTNCNRKILADRY